VSQSSSQGLCWLVQLLCIPCVSPCTWRAEMHGPSTANIDASEQHIFSAWPRPPTRRHPYIGLALTTSMQVFSIATALYQRRCTHKVEVSQQHILSAWPRGQVACTSALSLLYFHILYSQS
jgi:hypothetical protein